jgi:hypothetical protein
MPLEMGGSNPDRGTASQFWTAMGALSHAELGPSFGCRCGHIAKRADSIYRLIWINTVKELVEVHIFPGVFRPHAWVPKCTRYIGLIPTGVASGYLLLAK